MFIPIYSPKCASFIGKLTRPHIKPLFFGVTTVFCNSLTLNESLLFHHIVISHEPEIIWTNWAPHDVPIFKKTCSQYYTMLYPMMFPWCSLLSHYIFISHGINPNKKSNRLLLGRKVTCICLGPNGMVLACSLMEDVTIGMSWGYRY